MQVRECSKWSLHQAYGALIQLFPIHVALLPLLGPLSVLLSATGMVF